MCGIFMCGQPMLLPVLSKLLHPILIPLFQCFSLNWQHQLCKNPRSNPDIKTLFTDHACGPTNGSRPPPPTNNPLVGPIPKAGAFPPIGSHNVSNIYT